MIRMGNFTQNSKAFYDALTDRPVGLADLIMLLKDDYLKLKSGIESAQHRRDRDNPEV